MRRLTLDGPHALRLEAIDPPHPQDGEVLVALTAVGICGSDVHGYAGHNSRRPPGTVMGHEATGRVLAGGPGVDATLLGTQVAINPVVTCGRCRPCRTGHENVCCNRRLYGCTPELPGGFAEQMVVRATNVVPLPAGMSPTRAALIEPLSVGAHGASLAGLTGTEHVLVIGGGPIGIAAALAASRRAATVTVSEPEPARRMLLEALGLATVAPRDVPAGEADAVLECVGFEPTVAAALGAARLGGTVVLLGLAAERLPIDAAALVMGERRLLGSAVYTPADFADVAAWASETPLDLELIVQAEVGLDEVPRALEGYADGSWKAVKTIARMEPSGGPAPA